MKKYILIGLSLVVVFMGGLFLFQNLSRPAVVPMGLITSVPPSQSSPITEIPNEIHLDVPHNLQGTQAACTYLAVYNILGYYKENISLQDFLGVSGYYSSFAEMNYGLGFEKYHGKFYMIGGKVLPELGYISYFSQQIQFADYPTRENKETAIKEILSNRIPLLFLLPNENFWYLNAVRQRENPTITNFENLNIFQQPAVAHVVVITGYKQVEKDLFLEISDSGYENTQNSYYYVNFTNYLDFLEYVKNNRSRRSSYEDPLIDNTLIYKVIKDPENKFKLNEPDKSLHTLYKIIDSLYISASHLEGKIYDDKTAGKGVSVGCDMVELLPKLADTLHSKIAIKDSRVGQAESKLKEIPQILGTCSKLKELSVSDNQELTRRISSANNKLYDIVGNLSYLVNEKGKELKVSKNGTKIELTISPMVDNIYESNIRLGKGLIQTNISISNIKLSSGKYELVNNNIIRVTNANYPLSISFNAVSGEQVPLLLSIESTPDLKGQGIYHESGYSEILAQLVRF